MGIYQKYIFPRILDWILGSEEEVRDLRKDLLKDLKGEVLEIGFGTGLNLPYYPPTVSRLSVVDPNPGMHLKKPQTEDPRPGTASNEWP